MVIEERGTYGGTYDSGVKFETSAVGKSGVHFELLLEPGSIDIVNEALDHLVWYDAIQEYGGKYE